MDKHSSLPVQSKMRRCLLKDDGTVNYYLNAGDSTKKEDGTAANLTGADGQVMVEIPEHWRKFETEGTKIRVLLSEIQLPEFHFVPKVYRSAYEAAIDRTTSSAPKLASVVNNAPEFRGGNNTATWDSETRNLLGKPGTYTSLTNYRIYARRRGTAGKNGAGWNCDVYDIQKTCYWLYVVEYANLNSQLAFNAQPTSEGYRQGGLGDGVTTLNSTLLNTWNAQNPFVSCGYTNSLGNRTGVVDFAMPSEYGTALTVKVPSWRGLENLFGHVISITDGCLCNNANNQSLFLYCNDPSKFGYIDYYEILGALPRTSGHIKEMIIGKFGENMPKVATGASSTTFFCDMFSISLQGDTIKSIALGSVMYSALDAGLISVNSNSETWIADVRFGTRLCFIPE